MSRSSVAYLFLTVLLVASVVQCAPASAELPSKEDRSALQDPSLGPDAAVPTPRPADRPARSSWTCRLNAKDDPNKHEQLKKMAAEEPRTTHLVEYKFVFPVEADGSAADADHILTDKLPADEKTNRSLAYYKMSSAYRVFTSQGRLLIRMPFQRQATSLGLLQFGVTKMTVELVDSPPYCFRTMPTEGGAVSEKVRDLLLKDMTEFTPKWEQNKLWSGDQESICQQIIEHKDDDYARFAYNCCRPTQHMNQLACEVLPTDDFDVIKIMVYIPAIVKILFLLFGPLVLQWLFFPRSPGPANYIIPLKAELRKTILVKKIAGEDDRSSAAAQSQGHRKEMKHFVNFRQLVKSLPSEEIVQVSFSQMDISVTQSELLAENEVPVGLLHCLYNMLVRCSCSLLQRPPFNTCCMESLVGSWSPRYLWLPLRRQCDCNRGCRDCCPWLSIFRAIGWLLLVAGIPLPYYARLAVFYVYESEEMKNRTSAVDRLELNHPIDEDLFRWLTPKHGIFVTIYILYAFSFVLLLLLRMCGKERVDNVVGGCVDDLRRVSYSSCGRMVLAHLLLPFEKFGVFGLIVALIIWPIVLPCCLFIALFYFVPVFYVVGRLLVSSRPSCLHRLPLHTPPSAHNDADGFQSESDDPETDTVGLSRGTTSFDACCFLDRISPENRPPSPTPAASKNDGNSRTAKQKNRKNKNENRSAAKKPRNVTASCVTFFVRILLVILVLCVLVMYSEAVGFLLEIVCFTAAGAILNAGSGALRVVVLFVLGVIYAAACYWSAVDIYARFSRALFDGMKRHLSGDLLAAAALRRDHKRNTAFKYFTPWAGVAGAGDNHGGFLLPYVVDDRTAQSKSRVRPDGNSSSSALAEDSIEYRSNRLHWKVNSLALFIDHDDAARMPRDLFRSLCRLDVSGSPGSDSRVVLVAIGRLVGSFAFLALLALIVQLAADATGGSSISQAFVLAVCGAAPLVIYIIVDRCRSQNKLDDYSFAGKIERTILNYTRAWPVHDLSFRRAIGPTSDQLPVPVGSDELDGLMAGARGASDATEMKMPFRQRNGNQGFVTTATREPVDPTQVDLLITIRDEPQDEADQVGPAPGPAGVENLRSSERGSLGSGASVYDRTSPAADDIPLQSTGGGVIYNPGSGGNVANQPTNATRPGYGSTERRADGVGYHRNDPERVGFILRKQTSASTIPIRNQIKPDVGSSGDAGADIGEKTSSVVVVDLMADGDVTAASVKFPESAFNTSTPRNAVSTRSLPSYKDAAGQDGESESAL